jgi:aryl sulfotransferase
MEPQVTRSYQNHHLDSTRWEVYQPREGDIIVTTSYKSGTTWTQQILLWLLYGDRDPMPEQQQLSPWVDARFMGTTKQEIGELLEALPSPRFVKSHLPLDGLPYYPEVRYLIVARDARDVFMSLFNHYSSYTDIAMAALNSEDRPGDPLPRCGEDPRQVWRDWMTRGWFEWESEGWPMWSNLHHTQSYWEYRHLPNFLFLHYGDMLADLEGSVRRIAEFTSIPVSDDVVARTVEKTTFANVRKQVEATPEEEDMSRMFFEGGMRRFFFKGTNERWRGVLSDEDLALYEDAKLRVLSPDCAKWLEQGGPVR